jgi:hypothetical protein
MQQLKTLKQFEQDLNWINAHYDELKALYPEQFIAVYRGQVVGHAPQVETVMEDMKRRYGEVSGSIAVKYISAREDELIL